MNIQTYLETQGITVKDFAADLEVSRDLVYQWAKGIRPVAARHCWPIEKLTSGQVTRAELRPNDWMQLWPELASATKRRSRLPPKNSVSQ